MNGIPMRFLPIFTMFLFIVSAEQIERRDRVPRKDLQVLNLYQGQYTSGRRIAPVPHLQRTGGNAPGKYNPKEVRCYRISIEGENPWECEGDLDTAVEFGKLNVSCEGYEFAADPWIVAGSCGLVYELNQRGWATWVWVAFFFIAAWMVAVCVYFCLYNEGYSAFGFNKKHQRTPRRSSRNRNLSISTLESQSDADDEAEASEGAIKSRKKAIQYKGKNGDIKSQSRQHEFSTIKLNLSHKTIAQFYIVGESLNSGSYGEVYWAKDFKRTAIVAVKFEKVTDNKGYLQEESRMLQALARATPDEPILRHYEYGTTLTERYLIMELGGPNLRELKKETKYDQFRPETTLWIAKKMIEALMFVHRQGLVHRDVKPANFCIGRGRIGQRRLYIVDFGISRQYRDKEGKIIPPRSRTPFHGTLRYSSMNTHKRKDSGPVDDIWSVWYIAVENLVGQLPWRRLQKAEEVLEMKQKCAKEEYVKERARNPVYQWITPPSWFPSTLRNLDSSDYYTAIDYEGSLSKIAEDLKNMKFDDTTKLEWEF